jgi:hypothetical protein
MKKFIKLLSEYTFPTLVLILIIVVGLYIIKFAPSVSDKAEKLIASFAAVAATFFLYLAFMESKKSNELATQEHYYFELEKQIIEIERIAEKRVFNDSSIIKLSEIKFPVQILETIRYANFIYGIKGLYSHLEIDKSYQKCKSLIGDIKSIEIDNQTMQELRYIINLMSFLNDQLGKLLIYYTDVTDIYGRIDSFKLSRDLKKLLIARLNATMTEYFLLFEPQNEYIELAKYFTNFYFYQSKGNTLIKKGVGVHVEVRVFYNIIKKIRDSYEDPNIQYDRFKAHKPKF